MLYSFDGFHICIHELLSKTVQGQSWNYLLLFLVSSDHNTGNTAEIHTFLLLFHKQMMIKWLLYDAVTED